MGRRRRISCTLLGRLCDIYVDKLAEEQVLPQTEEIATLIRAHQAEIYRYLRYLGADAATAEDLVQETFLAVLRSGRAVAETEPGGAAWLRGIARNLFLQWCRSQRTAAVRADSESVERAEATWGAVFLREGDGFDYMEALRACYGTLQAQDRLVVDQRYAQHMSRADMAKANDLSEDGVKSVLRRIRRALAECVRRRLRLAEREGTA